MDETLYEKQVRERLEALMRELLGNEAYELAWHPARDYVETVSADPTPHPVPVDRHEWASAMTHRDP